MEEDRLKRLHKPLSEYSPMYVNRILSMTDEQYEEYRKKQTERALKWRQEHRERWEAYVKEYRSSEKFKKSNSAYYMKNRDKIKRRNINYYIKRRTSKKPYNPHLSTRLTIEARVKKYNKTTDDRDQQKINETMLNCYRLAGII